MNRLLFVPALCCLTAFGILLLVLHGAVGREPTTRVSKDNLRTGHTAYSTVAIEPARTPSAGSDPMNDSESEALLRKLSDEYLHPWREWENSPHQLYSRVAPTPVPPISAEVALSPQSASQPRNVALATITVRTGRSIEEIPCIVDRATGTVHLFADGEWLASEKWLKRAPNPRKSAVRV